MGNEEGITEVLRAVALPAVELGTLRGVSFVGRPGLDYVFGMGTVATVTAAGRALRVRTGVQGVLEGLGAA